MGRAYAGVSATADAVRGRDSKELRLNRLVLATEGSGSSSLLGRAGRVASCRRSVGCDRLVCGRQISALSRTNVVVWAVGVACFAIGEDMQEIQTDTQMVSARCVVRRTTLLHCRRISSV